MVNLTQKETMLLKDLRSHEEWCVKKYTDYANLAQDPQLKTMFTQFAQQERQHYDTVSQILNGQVPSTNQSQNQQQSQGSQFTGGMSQGTQGQPTMQVGGVQTAPQPSQQSTMQFGGAQTAPQPSGKTQPSQPTSTGTNPFTKSYQQANKGQQANVAPSPNAQNNVVYEFGTDQSAKKQAKSGQTGSQPTNANQRDIDLCYDLLNTEKYVSSTYDTVIFECKDRNVRQALNHIQKEEQEHGEAIFNYLQSKGAYNLQ